MPFAALFPDGFGCFLSGVKAVLGKKGRNSNPHFVALLNVNNFRMVIFLLNTRDAAALAYSRRRQYAIARYRVFQMVFLTSRAQTDATDVIDSQRRLRDRLGLDQNAWAARKAWRWWWNVDDSGALGLRYLRRFGFVVLRGVIVVI